MSFWTGATFGLLGFAIGSIVIMVKDKIALAEAEKTLKESNEAIQKAQYETKAAMECAIAMMEEAKMIKENDLFKRLEQASKVIEVCKEPEASEGAES